MLSDEPGRAWRVTLIPKWNPTSPLTRATGLIAVLTSALTSACGGKGPTDSTSGDPWSPSRRTTVTSDVASETVNLFWRLDVLVRALPYYGQPARERIMRRLATVEHWAKRIEHRTAELPDTAFRRTLAMLNRAAGRTASRIRRIIRLSERGKVQEARSLADIAAAELRHSMDELRGLTQ